jgi:hypothetical protein
VPEVVAGVVADERQHRHRVAAHDADLRRRGGGRLARQRRAQEDAVHPVAGLGDQRDRRLAAAAEEDRRDRHARGSSYSGARIGHCVIGVQNREFGCEDGSSDVGVQSRPFQSVRCAGGSAMPSHQMSPSSVRRRW